MRAELLSTGRELSVLIVILQGQKLGEKMVAYKSGIPCLGDDDVVKGGVPFAKAGEAYFDYHHLSQR